MSAHRDWEAEFEAIEYFPGSSRPIVSHREPKESSAGEKGWDNSPRVYVVNGQKEEFFTIGQLAHALNRQPVTVRKWESEGIIPKALFVAPSEDPRGRRRLYTRAQVEGILRIAAEEEILDLRHKPIGQTQFTRRVIELFGTLKGPGQ